MIEQTDEGLTVIRVLDLFCGCGGLSLGLNKQFFEIGCAVDNWDPAVRTFVQNEPNTLVINTDLNSFNQNLLDKSFEGCDGFDVVIGGPPCQGFSGMNRHRSISDPRNSLVETFVQTVEIVKPSVVLLENVTGIVSLGNGQYFKELIQSLENLGYHVDFRIFQSGYYGVPQNRWRFICIASKHGKEISFPEPVFNFHTTAAHNVGDYKRHIVRPIQDGNTLFGCLDKAPTVFDAIGDLPSLANGGEYEGEYQKEPESAFQVWYRHGSNKVQNHRSQKVGNTHLDRFKHIPKGKANSGWLDLPDHLKPTNLKSFSSSSYDNRFGRLNWDGTFNAIMGKIEPYWGRVIHPEQDRLISLRECARAQGFPDHFIFDGSFSEIAKMIGNAVSVPLAMALSSTIAGLFGKTDTGFHEFVSQVNGRKP